jgi:uncharacterized GH25 family protein
MTIFKKNNVAALAASVLLAAGLLPLQAHAHRSWLLPSSTQVEADEPWVTVDGAISENLFDIDHMPLKLEGVTVTGPDGAAVPLQNEFTGKLRSSFDLKLPKPGTYKISMATESVFASYKEKGEMKRWRGSPEAFAKEVPQNAEDLRSTRMLNRLETFVTSGDPSEIAAKPTGVGLEMVPLTHPNELGMGQEARFRLLLDGKPAANLPVAVVPGGVRYRGVLNEILVKSDAKGEFAVKWPKPGMYWISTSYPAREMQQQGQQPGQPPAMPARRSSYSATLEVLPL